MPVDVSVVVASFNTGEKIAVLLDSLAAQSLPADRFEIVVVDDGSTDDTWARLSEAARTTPNLRVERIENSGWPGRPRNVGLDLAEGRWVFFSDHDDEFFGEALERMVAYGDTHDADVVIGKEVRAGALTIGAELFERDLPRADLFADDVLALLTPHKLFRRSFLAEHDIRFPEGRRRLEDHVLLAQVYTRTDRIAVLASHPCYRWIIYPDGSNYSDTLGDPTIYFRSLEDVFDVLEAADIDEQRRDDLVRFWYETRMLRRLSPYWFDQWTPEYADAIVAAVVDLTRRRIPERLDAGLVPLHARRAALVRRGDADGLRAAVDDDRDVHLAVGTARMRWDAGRVRIEVTTTLAGRHDRPVRFVEHEGGLYRADDTDHRHDVRPWLLAASLEAFVRDRESGTEWYVPGRFRFTEHRTGDATVLRASGTFEVDPATAAFGRPLDDGVWVPYLHSRVLGHTNRPRLPAAGEQPAIVDGVPVVLGADASGKAVLAVGTSERTVQAMSARARVRGAGRRARIEVDLAELDGFSWPETLLRVDGTDLPTRRTTHDGGGVRLVAPADLAPGRHEIRLVVDGVAGPAMTATWTGLGASVVRTDPDARGRMARRARGVARRVRNRLSRSRP